MNKIQRSLNKIVAITGISVLSFTYAHAEVTLKVDENIKVTAINGNEVKQSAFKPLTKEFKLQPGKHVITAKYDRLYELHGDNHDYLRSGNVTVSAEMQDNQTYKLVMPNQPERYEEAKEYAKKPTLAVVQGSAVLAKAEGASRSGGIFSGLAGILGGGDTAIVDNQKAIASIESQPSTQTIAIKENASTLDKFMQLWLQATPSEREKIRQWVDK